MVLSPVEASFRDPSGFVFKQDGLYYRQINPVYQKHYEQLLSSGLYESLCKEGLLIAHQEVPAFAHQDDPFKTILPVQLPFISYPYEWSFSQLQDAALATLEIQLKALEHGMSLKDASAYNIQFVEGQAVFIDTLSFEIYQQGQVWQAYRQFCQHFLGPLLLMHHCDLRLSQLLKVYIDGIPLDLVSEMLPMKTRWSFACLSHIHWHARSQKKYADQAVPEQKARAMSLQGLKGLLSHLQSFVRSLSAKGQRTEWDDYYNNHNYSDKGFEQKKQLISDFTKGREFGLAWDLGANTGEFSRAIADDCEHVCAFDIDPNCVDQNYTMLKGKKSNILPLLLDLANPSPALGWSNQERPSLTERGPADLVMALALIHHLAISNNVPLARIAEYLSQCSKYLIIEFVPKEDSKVQTLLATREDIFPNYHQEHFEACFSECFEILERHPIVDSQRTLYFMQTRLK